MPAASRNAVVMLLYSKAHALQAQHGGYDIAGGFSPALAGAVTRVVDGVAEANIAQHVIIHARERAPVAGPLAAGGNKGDET